jgi:hypothetical protein
MPTSANGDFEENKADLGILPGRTVARVSFRLFIPLHLYSVETAQERRRCRT